ncbi:MAG: sulfite exporter TauE/SafE family protein [Chloroflexota bacterium]|nr:sulfite exporter TauE/SafE family protein [Chloroflexota bacterium]MDE2884654.1 sulfite exporter TauE/SafE family protein [Chloroflexota bacterium]
MPDLPLVIASALAVLLASTTQGATGFGFVIVSAPVMAVYLDPKLVVPVVLVLGVALGVPLMVHTRREFSIRRVWPMMLAGAAFTPIGTLVLTRLDAPQIKILLGLVAGAVSLALLFGFQREARNQRLASIPVGAASGLLTGATGLAGAPVILFFANQGVEQRQFRADIVYYLQAVSFSALPSYIVAGVLTAEAVRLAAVLLPAGVVGVSVGMWLSGRIPALLFRRIALGIVLSAAAIAVSSGVTG